MRHRPEPAGLLIAAVLLVPLVCIAHPLAPSLWELKEIDGGRFSVTWKVPRVRAPESDPTPSLPEHCRADLLKTDVDALSLRRQWSVDCGPTGLVGSELRVNGLRIASDTVLVRVVLSDGRTLQSVLSPQKPAFMVAARPSRSAVMADYFVLGTHHILGGFDHLLFVFGLLLLVLSSGEGSGWRGVIRRLLATISAFTAGHCVTLSLAAVDMIHPPSALVEVAIALSVFALAVELARGPDSGGALRRFPWRMAMAFGLLHGLGFASALLDAGLPAGEVPLALASFNIGIEAGQILFVLCILGAYSALRRTSRQLPRWLLPVPVYVMGSLAAFWSFQRLAAFLR